MKYAVITGTTCTNIIAATAEYAEKIGAVELAAGFGIGDIYDSGEWKHPEPPPYEPTITDNLSAMAVDHEYRLTLLELGLTDFSL